MQFWEDLGTTQCIIALGESSSGRFGVHEYLSLEEDKVYEETESSVAKAVDARRGCSQGVMRQLPLPNEDNSGSAIAVLHGSANPSSTERKVGNLNFMIINVCLYPKRKKVLEEAAPRTQLARSPNPKPESATSIA